ncbi:MAG: hypothetical protein H6823_11470 [Planctomycetaceae bacterium]|nr:hypothetical protein [Planctomycetales bacterium]MCB9938855.1 hypothetical protein [Planctomycetaceae bacterium]
MFHRFAILLLLLIPSVASGRDLGISNGHLVAPLDSTSMSLPLPLAQQDAGAGSMTIDTHELSKKLGGMAVLAVIVLIVILAVKGKKPK